MKHIIVSCVIILGLSACSIRDDSQDIAQCRDIAQKRVAKAARSVDATYNQCVKSRATKRQSQERTDTVVAIAELIDDIFN